MQLQTFLNHHGLRENPFTAEEARDDPVFQRLLDHGSAHPDFEKIFGQPTQPRAAVVFGEKGSGKTALRLMVEQKLEALNRQRENERVWIVRYDALNPVLDRFARHHGNGSKPEQTLEKFRLVDHMDAMLSQSVTRVVDGLLQPDKDEPGLSSKAARNLSRQQRHDLAELALLYDQPRAGNYLDRFTRLRRMLRVGRMPWGRLTFWLGVLSGLGALGLLFAQWMQEQTALEQQIFMGVALAAAVLLLGVWSRWWVGSALLARRINREVRVVEHDPAALRSALQQYPHRELADQPIPEPDDQDGRYQLIQRLIDVLGGFGYVSMVILVDRLDEPAMVNGEPRRMRALVWPMLNNKFLQQERVGVKLLLPIELGHLLNKEDAAFFQTARLDKANLIERLDWSGTQLYDLCSARLQACRADADQTDHPISLADLFAEEVTERDLIDALDQMHQPRDAFKFVYRVVQEHCSTVPEDQPTYRIPRLTLDHVRKEQSDRVQQLYRGLSPA